MSRPGARALGASQTYTLKLLERSPIGAVKASELKAVDFIEHCRTRRAANINAATVNQDMTYLRVVLKYAADAWDMPVNLAAWEKAKPQLVRQQLIGKSKARTRRPTQEELDRLIDYFRAQNGHWRTVIPMDVITEFSVLTARRISETCRIRWEDLNHEKRTCIVRDLKNPKGKGEHGEFPLLGRAWDLVMAQPKVDGEPRIFPYNAKSAGARYTEAKRRLGIKGLRLHDNRREAISRMFEQGYNVPEVAKLSLHKNPSLLLNVYTALKPEDLHHGPASKRQQATAQP